MGCERHSRERACEKIAPGTFARCTAVIPAKAGIHLSCQNKLLAWVPASAGTTLRAGFQAFQPIRRYFHALEGGNPCQQEVQVLHNLTMGSRLRACKNIEIAAFG